jgi:nucleotide-binding universal stress UspA family protein
MFKVIVVGADSSLTSRRAVEAAAELAALSGAALHIVTGYDTKRLDDKSLPSEFKSMSRDGEADAILQIHSFIAKEKGIEPTMHKGSGDPADVIVKTADQVGADLIVVGNRGMQGVRRVLGSVPNSVAHSANCSVAIIDTTE